MRRNVMVKRGQQIETKLIHAGNPEKAIEGAVNLPVFQSSTFLYTGGGSYHDLKYIRLNNTPNHVALHRKLAALENAENALVTASGMAAISVVFLTFLSPGDHFLAQNCLYGGTHSFITNDLSKLGISFDYFDGSSPGNWESLLRPETKIIYVETMTNPLLGVADLQAVADFAKANGLISVIDNTFASPVNFRPSEWGFDLSLHSCTKYLNGHSDIVAGAVIGSADRLEKVTHTMNHLGGSLDPHACFLLDRGLKTLAVRMRYQNESALKIARFLTAHPNIQQVNYPGLESHPGHERARALFDGFSGMLSFELTGDVKRADDFLEKVQLPFVAPSLGGVESLITRPATTSHSGMLPREREALGISDTLIRFSVGLEATDDLIEDLEQALRDS
ncbi:MAG: PLP-dependent aspartate aminotransferase family protein [Deltaproteobacteria bacterium]